MNNCWIFVVFQVPRDFDILRTMDLLFKIHLIFNIDFDPGVKYFFDFLCYFVYDIGSARNIKPTNKMKDIFNKLNK